MSPADRAASSSYSAATAAFAAVLVLSSLQLAAAGGRVVHPNRGSVHLWRHDDDTAGACALAVTPLGYPCEEHQVVTMDGYILSLQRIPRGRRAAAAGARSGKPVLLQHGVLLDGTSWLLTSPEESLAFVLADHGFDVWIANTRGTRWSRRHVSLDPSSRLYWNWSWDDLVVNGFPALVDYVGGQTQQKPHYVGHSLGTLVPLAAFSEGKVVDKLKSAVLLTPVAYLAHIPTPLGVVLSKAFAGEVLSDVLGVAEFNPTAPPVADLVRTFCSTPGMNCYDLVSIITGQNFCLNSSTVNEFLKYEPQPTSTKTMVHFAQTVRARDGVITKYDYVVPSRNVASYGQAEPPAYNMSNIPADSPLFLGYGGRDALADPTDVRGLLGDRRGHHPDKITVQYLQHFAHLDYVVGVCAKDYVYKDVIAFLERFK